MRVALELCLPFLIALAPSTEDARLLPDVPTRAGAIDVRCEAVELPLRDGRGRSVARMHAYAYSVPGGAERPITFLWNGGPGAAAAFLHTGFAGPVVVPSGTERPELNARTLVDLTDLVYVDPVGTGHSRAAGGVEARAFWGVEEDAEAAAAFVEAFLERAGARGRPLLLCGESYGAVRVGAMLEPLARRGIAVDGLILVSPALESRLLSGGRGREVARLARADRLPTLAALMEERGLREAHDPRRFVEEACEFAHEVYLDALELAEELSEEELGRLLRARDAYTAGRELRDARGRDQHDARLPATAGEIGGVELDELGDSVRGLLRVVFGVEKGGEYRLMNMTANRRWRAPGGRARFFEADLRVPGMIAAAHERGAGPRVFVAGGWYDLVTPFATAHRLLAEGAFGAAPVEVRDYPAGHVVYADDEAHAALAADLRAWMSAPSVP